MAIPTGWNALGFTSGRRTYLGNRRVGGVANSDHLNGTAADFTASPAALRAQFGPGVRILDEGDHRHVSGLSDVPFYGRNGTAGLVNGIDTSAPKGNSMISPRKPPVKPPVVPPMVDVPLGIEGSQPIDMTVDLSGIAPAPHVKKGGLFGSGLSLGEALVYGLNGYLAGVGNQAGASNLDMMFGRAKIDDERNFAREQLAAKIAADREERLYDAAHPKPTQTDRYIQEILNPNTPPARKALLRQVVARPIGVPVYDEQGGMTTQFYYPDQMPGLTGGGEDEWEYSN